MKTHASLKPGEVAPGDLAQKSLAVLRTHESKSAPGALIASLAIPWGFNQGDNDQGGYHLVWSRDMVETAGGLLAAGAHEDIWASAWSQCSTSCPGMYPLAENKLKARSAISS
jgi:GH15 family glucan-1,4-alpha-glucosidase